jgi:hypothetical protein
MIVDSVLTINVKFGCKFDYSNKISIEYEENQYLIKHSSEKNNPTDEIDN